MDYRQGDFVRILSPERANISEFRDWEINIFKISTLEHSKVFLKDYSIPLSITGIEPIPIDGKSDLQIYYDPIIAASIIGPGEETPVHWTNYEYYFDRFKNCTYENKSFQQWILEKNLRFVHEVQHFLNDELQNNGLKIRLY